MGRQTFLIATWLALSTRLVAEPFTCPESGVKVDAPPGFTALSREEILLKYPTARPPSIVFGNARRSTTIACNLTQDRLLLNQLSEAQSALSQVMERIVPGIEWKQRSLVSQSGQTWIYFELTSRAIDTDIYNIMLATSLQGRMLVFNFNSTKSEFPTVEAALRRSILTIALPGK